MIPAGDSTCPSREEAEVKRDAEARAGIGTPLTESLPRVAALLGPLLAGPVGTLLQGLVQ